MYLLNVFYIPTDKYNKMPRRGKKRNYGHLTHREIGLKELEAARDACKEKLHHIKFDKKTAVGISKSKKTDEIKKYNVTIMSRVARLFDAIVTYVNVWYDYPLLKNRWDFNKYTLESIIEEKLKRNEDFSDFLTSDESSNSGGRVKVYEINKDLVMHFLFMVDGFPVTNTTSACSSFTNMGLKARHMNGHAASCLDVFIPTALVTEDV